MIDRFIKWYNNPFDLDEQGEPTDEARMMCLYGIVQLSVMGIILLAWWFGK